jgi:uncharacterized protein HemY
MNNAVITRLRQNAVNLIARDQDVQELAQIIAELCLVCEEQEKLIAALQNRINQLPEGDELNSALGASV